MEITSEPVSRQLRDAMKRARLLEQMRRPWNDLQFLRRVQLRKRLTVQIDDDAIQAADDQQCRRRHLFERRLGEVGTAAARHDGANEARTLRRRDQRGRGPRACAKEAKRKRRGWWLDLCPVERRDDPFPEQRSVEAKLCGPPTASSCSVKRSSSSVARCRCCNDSATARFRALSRLLPLPCANTTNPCGSVGRLRSPFSATPARSSRTGRGVAVSAEIVMRTSGKFRQTSDMHDERRFAARTFLAYNSSPACDMSG